LRRLLRNPALGFGVTKSEFAELCRIIQWHRAFARFHNYLICFSLNETRNVMELNLLEGAERLLLSARDVTNPRFVLAPTRIGTNVTI